jgi:hypothetical protein
MEHRQSILVEYKVSSTFIIPEGIDIHNKDQVLKWYIVYDTLHIVFADTDRPEITVRPYYSAKDDDLKYYDNVVFEHEEVDEDYKDEDYVD